jgi:hypothetical protein
MVDDIFSKKTESKKEGRVPRVLKAWRDKFIALVKTPVDPRHEWKKKQRILQMQAREQRIFKPGVSANRAWMRKKHIKKLTRGAFAKYGQQFSVAR